MVSLEPPSAEANRRSRPNAQSGSRDLPLNFGTPSISKERLKVETSNFVCGLTARRPIQEVAKLGQLGTEPGSRDLLLNFGTPSISNER